MNVLSLFDGMSCGQIALERTGIEVGNYFASEIKKIAIDVTQANYPNTIQLGDVRAIKACDLPKIDLLIGGSPCQDFSIMNKTNDTRLGLKGEKSRLFFEFARLLKECKPAYFLLENVVMEPSQSKIISGIMGVPPVRINASLIGPVRRDRLYWTNIPGTRDGLLHKTITQPKRIQAPLNDILSSGWTPKRKGRALLRTDGFRTKPHRMVRRWYVLGFGNLIFVDKAQYYRVTREFNRGNHEPGGLDGIRPLNKEELHRCHDIPAGYCDILSYNQTHDVIGDGWHVGVVAHIMKGLPRK